MIPISDTSWCHSWTLKLFTRRGNSQKTFFPSLTTSSLIKCDDRRVKDEDIYSREETN